LFHPETIVVGGGLSLVGEPLRASVAAKLPRYLMSVMEAGPSVKLSLTGEDAVPVGCLLAAGQ
jgi:glucokinase